MTKSKRSLKADERKKAKRAAKRRARAQARAGSPLAVQPDDGPRPLAARSEIDPTKLIRGTADIVGEFMVAFAAIFDDLKDLAAFEQPMLPVRPESTDTSVAAGEWRGRHNTLHRFIAGVLHELIELIAKKSKILDETEFKQCVGALEVDARRDWDAVVDIALKRGDENTAMRQTLAYVRNNASFHYTALGEIGKGWQKYFVEDLKNEMNRAAVYCVGDSMETTRFHFADAAFQTVAFRGSDKLKNLEAADGRRLDKRLVETAQKVNVAIRFLVAEFIRRRGHPGA